MADESGVATGFRFAVDEPIGDGYEVVEPLARGSLGEVYRARTKESGREVTLRLLAGLSDAAARAPELPRPMTRFAVNVLDLVSWGSLVIVVTEPYPTTLAAALRSGGPLEPRVALRRVRELTSALLALEGAEAPPPVLSPEGIACWPDGMALDEYYLPTLYRDDALPFPIDRVAYLPPDFEPNSPTIEAAVYGLGGVLHQLLTACPVVQGAAFEQIARATRGEFTIAVPEPFAGLIGALLAPRGANRPRPQAILERLDQLDSPVIELVDRGPRPTSAAAEGSGANDGPRLSFSELNEYGMQVFTREPDQVRMVLVPGGTFRMGSAHGRPEENPCLDVTVGPFLIDEYPMTWRALLHILDRPGSNPPLRGVRRDFLPTALGGERGAAWRWNIDPAVESRVTADHPVVLLTHDEVSALARSLELDLPSEAEWEFAARGGTTTEYWWGDAFDTACAWCSQNGEDAPQPVGKRPANPFGLFDILGNVAEFCRDRFHKDAYARVAAAAEDDPAWSARQLVAGIREPSGRRSLRGGSFQNGAAMLRCAARQSAPPSEPVVTAGFRFVIRPSNAPAWASAVFEEMEESLST